MPDLSNVTSVFSGYFASGTFWFVIALVVIVVLLFFYGYFSRKGKLKYFCLEFVRFGNGKVGINKRKAGIFGTKTFLGFFDYGREKLMKTSDGRIIQGAKTSYLHDIFGKKGFILIRSPRDNKILVPISKAEFANMNLLMSIAPGDFRDASSRIFHEAVEETKGTWEKLLPYIAIGLCVVLTIINVVVNMQMTNHTTDTVGNMLITGCKNTQNVKAGTSP
jgi:hypothetical protein